MGTQDVQNLPINFVKFDINTHQMAKCKWLLGWSVTSLYFRWLFRYLIRNSNILLHWSIINGWVKHGCSSAKYNTLESWRVSFSRIGECLRKQLNILRSLAMSGHHSLSNKVFSLLNVGHNFKSLLTMNCAKEQNR
jgi:hypothetical protein